MRKTAIIVFMALMSAAAGFGQSAYTINRDSGKITSSGGTWTHINTIGELNTTFELLINGAPTSSTITIQGCGRGNVASYGSANGLNGLPVVASTCDTLDSYTGNVNGNRKVTGLYDSYVVTFTPTGGTSPSLQINTVGSAASSPVSLNDPCQSNAVKKQSVVVNISSATTTQLVALAAGQSIYVCGIYASAAGTAPTAQFEYGTGSSCGTGTTSLTGTIVASTTVPLELATGITNFTAPTGNALCLVSGGTPNFQGVVTYVQAP